MSTVRVNLSGVGELDFPSGVSSATVSGGVATVTLASAGSGTVTSVALTGDGTVFNSGVTGSPVTTAGTLAPTLKAQSPNLVLAGPTSGAAVAPTFRSLVTADIPNLPASIITTGLLALARGGTNADLSATGGTSQVLKQVSVGGAITVAQLAASDLSNGVTGSGAVVLATSPTLVTPTLGVATATSITGSGQLKLAETSDTLGSLNFYLRNRSGQNGGIFENPSVCLSDLGLQTSAVITNIAIDASNNLTVTAAFASGASTLPAVGQKVTLSGLTTATFLNGQVVTIATISTTQFTASFTHAAYTSAPDTGTAAAQNNVRGEFRNDKLLSTLNTSGEIQFFDPTNATTGAWLASGVTITTINGGLRVLPTTSLDPIVQITSLSSDSLSNAALLVTHATDTGQRLRINKDGSVAFGTATTSNETVLTSGAAGSGLLSLTGSLSASAGFRYNGAATTGNVLRGNGTNFVDATLAFSDLSGVASTAQIPNLDASKITTGLLALARGGTNANLSATGGTSQVLQQTTAGAAITVGQLAFSDISGTASTAQIPNLDASKITTGLLALARGGTNANLSATGGTSQVLQQASAGAAITVGQLAASNLSNGTTGSGAVVLAASPTISGTLTASLVTGKRYDAHQGTAVVTGDFAISSGWGASATKSLISGTDQAGTITITASGTITANPTVILTFHDGAWANGTPIAVAVRGDGNAPATGFWIINGGSTTTAHVQFQFVGTPVSGSAYTLNYICMGT